MGWRCAFLDIFFSLVFFVLPSHKKDSKKFKMTNQLTNSSTSLLSLLTLCNDAARLLRDGRYAEALLAFHKTLAIIRNTMMTNDDETDGWCNKGYCCSNSRVECYFSSPNGSSSPTFVTSNGEVVSMERNPNKDDEEDSIPNKSAIWLLTMLAKDASSTAFGNNGAIFCDPIFVQEINTSPSSLSTPSISKLDFEKLSYAAVYNMALTYHLYAISSNSNSTVQGSSFQFNMRKALKLYESAHKILTCCQLPNNNETSLMSAMKENYSQSGHESELHLMSIIYNLVNVHYCLGKDANSQFCYDRFISLILYLHQEQKFSHMSSSSSNPRTTTKGTAVTVESFVRNVINFYVSKKKVIAPAA